MINQIRYVTKKLKDQSLNESSDNNGKVGSEERDSGTESDDEQPYEEPEPGSEMSSEVSSGCSVRSRPTSQTSTDTLTCDDLPMAGDAPDMPPPSTVPTASVSSSTGPYHHPSHLHHHPHHHHLHHTHHPHPRRARTPRHPHPSSHPSLRTPDPHPHRESPALDSPIEPFLDSAFVSDCDACDPVEHHSSEEELENLTGAGSWSREAGPPEKRKWSQVARLSLTDSGSSDEEVCVLTTGSRPPVQFRTSPPLEAHKPLRSVSPPTKMLSLASSDRESLQACGGGAGATGGSGSPEVTCSSEGGTTPRAEGGARAASPRKRHRQTPRPHQMHRPCLDFEKMQQMKNRAVTQWRNGGELSLSFC